MATPKDVLVITSSTIDGIKIRKYLKPVSAHIVAGTNLFSDFMGGLTDVFGGRSQAYQKQLASLYNEAIERIKYSAYELGANCVIGLSIDMDEISGKGKSMFMLTAVGTAVVLEDIAKDQPADKQGRLENVGIEKINTLKTKNQIIERSTKGKLELSEENWEFITANQVHEVFPFVLHRYQYRVINENDYNTADSVSFFSLFEGYVGSLPDDYKAKLLYDAIREESNSAVILRLSKLIKELNLYDFEKSDELLRSEHFANQKKGLRLVTYDKPFYNNQDLMELKSAISYIENNFKERGTKTHKKQLLSKEKEVWVCECGKTNDLTEFCSGCQQDIYGFKESEINPIEAIRYLSEKSQLIAEFIN